MVLLLLPLRVTIVKLSIVANFHVVNLSFRLNEMVVNTNCKFYKTNANDFETYFFFAEGINFYVYCILFRDPIL